MIFFFFFSFIAKMCLEFGEYNRKGLSNFPPHLFLTGASQAADV